ncbi:hypothetical protein G7046_g5389 [Stylonectria norvegica]|nr:hypothetical protein G7046_g5389 [Stylonectria norvegica]
MARPAAHIPRYPRGFIILRILQLVLSILILGLLAYAVYIVAFSGNCLMLFTAACTVIFTGWLTCAYFCAPGLYNYWAVLALEIFLLIFWLNSFSLLAVQTTYYWAVGSGYCDTRNCYHGSLSDAAEVYGSILAAATGLGAIELLFFFISLIIHSVVVCRHRRGGRDSKRSGTDSAPLMDGGQYLQLQDQGKSNYQAVPQYGLPSVHDIAYDSVPAPQPQSHGQARDIFPPQPRQQQQLYDEPTPQPLVSELAGVSPLHPTPPPLSQGAYQGPFSQPSPPPSQEGMYHPPPHSQLQQGSQ